MVASMFPARDKQKWMMIFYGNASNGKKSEDSE
jgi:hypothetical protein